VIQADRLLLVLDRIILNDLEIVEGKQREFFEFDHLKFFFRSSCPPRPATCNSIAFENPHPNPYLLIGALVGGSRNFTDNRQDDTENRLSLDGNAGFQSAVAGLLHYRMKKLI